MAMSIKQKIIIATGLSVAISFSGAITYISYQNYTSLKEQVKQDLHDAIEKEATIIGDHLRIAMDGAKSNAIAALSMKKAGAADRNVMNQILEGTLNEKKDAIGIWQVWEPNAFDGKDDAYRLDWPKHDPTGRYVPYLTRGADGKAQVDVLNSSEEVKEFPKYKDNLTSYKPKYEESGWGEFYSIPKKRQKETVTEPFYYDVQGVKLLESSFVAPIFENGKFLGVSALDFALSDLQKKYGDYHSHNGSIELSSEAGFIIASSIDPAMVGKNTSYKVEKESQFNELNDGSLVLREPINIGVPDQHWNLLFKIDSAVLYAPAIAMLQKAVLSGVIAVLFIIALLFILISHLLKPLEALKKRMEELAQGDADLTSRLEVKSHDEIGAVSHSFNVFVEHLALLFRNTETDLKNIFSGLDVLKKDVEHVAKASSYQSDEAGSTAASVEEVTVSIQHIADSTKVAKGMATLTFDATQEGMKTTNEITQDIQIVQKAMLDANHKMVTLGDRSKEINNILTVIKDIASQTNLLALNAAIEAARAGEQGRGFAVVADEVRKLAARTSDATLEISTIVDAINGDTQQAITSVKNTYEYMNGAVTSSERLTVDIEKIHINTESLFEQIDTIATAITEQSQASEMIAQNIEVISNHSQENHKSAGLIMERVKESHDSLDSLLEMLSRYKK